MKKYQNRIIALALLGAFAISSCSVQYRERRREHRYHHHDDGTTVIIHN